MAKLKLEDGTEIEAFTKEEMDAEVGGLKAKVSELLALHDKEKSKLSELEQARLAEEEARKKERGEFKELYEKTVSDLAAERETAAAFATKIKQREIETAAYKIAGTLTKDAKRAAMLAKEITQFARHSDAGVGFEIGGIATEADKVGEYLKTEFPFLVDGSGSTGGGAQGGSSSGKATAGKPDGTLEQRAAHLKEKYKLPT